MCPSLVASAVWSLVFVGVAASVLPPGPGRAAGVGRGRIARLADRPGECWRGGSAGRFGRRIGRRWCGVCRRGRLGHRFVGERAGSRTRPRRRCTPLSRRRAGGGDGFERAAPDAPRELRFERSRRSSREGGRGARPLPPKLVGPYSVVALLPVLVDVGRSAAAVRLRDSNSAGVRRSRCYRC